MPPSCRAIQKVSGRAFRNAPVATGAFGSKVEAPRAAWSETWPSVATAVQGRATGVRRLAFCGAVWLASESFTAFVPAGHQQRARSVRVSGATPAALLLATLSAEARADDSDAEGWSFNPFYIVAFLVVVGVVRLIGWVFSLKPEMDADADGYRSTTLRGRDSEENLQRRIAEMEARLALEEKQRQALIAGKATATRGQDDVDDDLFSSDLDAQLRAARNS